MAPNRSFPSTLSYNDIGPCRISAWIIEKNLKSLIKYKKRINHALSMPCAYHRQYLAKLAANYQDKGQYKI